jgi:hypothetical protein
MREIFVVFRYGRYAQHKEISGVAEYLGRANLE